MPHVCSCPQGPEKELGLLVVMSSLMWVPGFELGSCGRARAQLPFFSVFDSCLLC